MRVRFENESLSTASQNWKKMFGHSVQPTNCEDLDKSSSEKQRQWSSHSTVWICDFSYVIIFRNLYYQTGRSFQKWNGHISHDSTLKDGFWSHGSICSVFAINPLISLDARKQRGQCLGNMIKQAIPTQERAVSKQKIQTDKRCLACSHQQSLHFYGGKYAEKKQDTLH